MKMKIHETYSFTLKQMEGESSITFFSPSGMAIAIIIVLLCIYAAYTWFNGRPTVPAPTYISGFANTQDASGSKQRGVFKDALYADEWFANPPGSEAANDAKIAAETKANSDIIKASMTSEGFYGGVAIGAGAPDCLRSSSEGSALIAIFSNRSMKADDDDNNSADLKELTQIVSKLSCFKKDLVSPSYVVDSTRYQQFVTMHDIEPIAETTGRCFAKTISPRDLEIAFDKWTSRGETLVSRLCAAEQLDSQEVLSAQGLFRSLIRDVKDIARGACLQGEPMIAGKPGPRDPHPFENPEYEELGPYTGYY